MRDGLVKLGNIYSFYVFQLVLPQICAKNFTVSRLIMNNIRQI